MACAQFTTETPPRAEIETPVRERRHDRFVHLRHARQQRVGPRRRQHVETRPGMTLLQDHEQALRQHHVADPGRADDEQALGHAGQRRGRELTRRRPGDFG
jgi:hypothetical protein